MSAAPIPPPFTARLDSDEGVAVVVIEGELDLDTADAYDAVAVDAIAGDEPVVIDFTACTFMDSTGLQRTLRHREAAARAGRGLALVVPEGGPVARLIDLVAPGLFVLAPTRDGARTLALGAA
jgi:anti-sigma B factor antagonist